MPNGQAGSVQNDSATYSNSQSFNNSIDNVNPNSMSGANNAGIEEKRQKKRQRKQEKTRKVQSKVIYKHSDTAVETELQTLNGDHAHTVAAQHTFMASAENQ